MTRTSRFIAVVAGLAVLLVVGAVAVATRPIFTELGDSPLDATASTEPLDESELGVTFSRGEESPSLQAMQREGLLPFQWPWFSDQVPTPDDALAGGSDLVEVVAQVPSLAGLKVLSAERRTLLGESDLEWRFLWIKVNDNELLRVGTQLITPNVLIPADARDTVVAYAGGQAAFHSESGAVLTRLVVENRLVLVDLHAVRAGVDLSMTADELLAIAALIIELKA